MEVSCSFIPRPDFLPEGTPFPPHAAPDMKTYGVIKSPNGKNEIIGPISPRTKGLSNIIYMFLNEENGKMYFGSVCTSLNGNNVWARLLKYKFEWRDGKINHELHKRNRYFTNGVLKLIRDIGNKIGHVVDHIQNVEGSPAVNLSWRIVEILPPTATEREVLEAEARKIDTYHTNDPKYGYNQSDPRTEPSRTGKRKKPEDCAYRPSSSEGKRNPRRALFNNTNNAPTASSEPRKSSRIARSLEKENSLLS